MLFGQRLNSVLILFLISKNIKMKLIYFLVFVKKNNSVIVFVWVFFCFVFYFWGGGGGLFFKLINDA